MRNNSVTIPNPVRRLAALVLAAASLALPAAASAQQATGTVRGRVLDEAGAPAVAAQVTIVGTQLGTQADNAGNYVIRGVPAGTQTVRATRIGLTPRSQVVTVAAGGDVTADFNLQRAVARLEEVVTTATGQTSRRETGNVVASIKADTLASVAPIKNVNELLQARTAGVQIIQGQGVIGASSSIRIRGTSSLSLSNEPLIVVDGIRLSNEAEPGNTANVRINRFSTIDPQEIESIDIIKGPSASALYGTAAANGVIVIKTKRGRVGGARWTAFAQGGLTEMPVTYPTNYWSWGHNLNSAGQPTGNPVQCKLAASALKQCAVDSLTTYNPWTAPETNPWKRGPTSQYGLQVSGGGENLRYFFAADRQQETGPYRMPDFEIDRITQTLGARPRSEQIRPNQLGQTALRGTFTFPIGKNANLDVSSSFTDRDLYAPFDATFFAGLSNQMLSAPGYRTATNGTAREYVGDLLSVTNRLQLQRFTGSANLTWALLPWLTFAADGGTDYGNANNTTRQLPGEGPNKALAWGPTSSQGYSGIDIYRTNSLNYTANARFAAERKIGATIRSTSTVGGSWFKSDINQLFGEGYGLGVGSVTPTAAAQRLASTSTTQNATYGAYLQQQFAWAERLYWTAAARLDQNSAFGRNVSKTVYPSTNLSYVISDESWFPRLSFLDRLRLRGSWGQAGLQPGTTAALAFLQPLTYPAAAGDVPGLTVQSIGNQALKPEITTETEVGLDVGFFRERLNFEVTYFNKQSRDQLFQRPLPPSYGVGGTQWVNVARVDNKGLELTVDAQPISTRPFSWSIRANGSHVKNKLVDIGDIQLSAPQGARNVVGYPLFGLWDRPYTFSDANGDGIIVASEITLAEKDAFRGSTLPEYEAGVTNTLGFLNNAVTVTALVDYRGNFWNSYGIGYNRAVSAGNAPEVNVPGSSLEDQAAAVAASTASLKNTRWGIFKENDFAKLREVSVQLKVPDRFASRYMRARTSSLVFSGRNLATLWTKYPGLDPEANRSVNNTGGGNDDLGTPPALRYWTVRLNLGF
jgi:TonB-linked SusC/RagA family outer membrane protein